MIPEKLKKRVSQTQFSRHLTSLNPASPSERLGCYLGSARILLCSYFSPAMALNTQNNLIVEIADYDLDSAIGLSAFGRVIGGHGPCFTKAAHANHAVRRQRFRLASLAILCVLA